MIYVVLGVEFSGTTLTSELIHHSRIKKQSKNYDDWGFKDPRSIVTYPLWHYLLPQHRIIAIYRNPAGNWPRHRWRGLRKRYSNPLRAYVHLRQWYEYNEAILTIGSMPGDDFLLLNYEKLMHSEDEINRLQAFLGKPLEDMRKVDMHRSRTQGDTLFKGIRWLMQFGAYSPRKMLNRLEAARSVQCRVFQKKYAGN